nr:MAG TPA: hypothetical protein [Caudoviricetes sp.]
MTCDWLILIPVAFLGMYQLHKEGKLNIRGVLIEPVKILINLFRK